MPKTRQQGSRAYEVAPKTSLSRTLTLGIVVAFHILLLSALTFGILSTAFRTRFKYRIESSTNARMNTELNMKVPSLMPAHSVHSNALGVQIEEQMDVTNRLVEMGEEGQGRE
ncbi:hypothetical protein BKA64DRAFT_642290 [Cadophora sp. MPI-SDFR-AT-0126]|nr:hypothetical protein BKA64DRAFT_642290 [Leotiomycetes sp. MPI-SDFR-AT-0126]